MVPVGEHPLDWLGNAHRRQLDVELIVALGHELTPVRARAAQLGRILYAEDFLDELLGIHGVLHGSVLDNRLLEPETGEDLLDEREGFRAGAQVACVAPADRSEQPRFVRRALVRFCIGCELGLHVG